MSQRRFPPPWTVEKIPGGFKVVDANGQALAYLYSRETAGDANIAGVLTEDEAWRIASNIAKLPTLALVGRSLVGLRRRCLLAVDTRRLRLDLPLSTQFRMAGRRLRLAPFLQAPRNPLWA